MKKIKEKGFTLIELIAVLVILAIIALIVTPLVMSIIRKARVSADKRSIDAYGRSIELAIAGYLLDNGKFPTKINQLTIEYSGNKVECETTQLNSDSSVYLSGCTVNGRSVDYTYGTDKSPSYDAYSVGEEVTYNNVDYYVLKNSGTKEQTVTLLKAEPLTVSEVNMYGGVGTENNHVNMYVTDDTSSSSYRQASNVNGYGGIAYYSSPTCGNDGSSWVSSECKNDYAESEVKYVVDAWKTAQAPGASEARLITYEELTTDLGCINDSCYNSSYSWLSGDYSYWTMTQKPHWSGNAFDVWSVGISGGLDGQTVSSPYDYVVRPVITISKSVLN